MVEFTSEKTVRVRWHPDVPFVLHYTLSPIWNTVDMAQAIQTGYAMTATVAPSPVQVFVDATHIVMVPPGAMFEARRHVLNRPQHEQQVVVAARHNTAIGAMHVAASLGLLGKYPPQLVKSEEAALVYLQRADV